MMSMSNLVLLLGLVVVVTGKLEIPKIQILKQQTKVLSEQNPKNGPVCFSTYKPKLDSISTQYEMQYSNCEAAYHNSNSQEDQKWDTPRAQMENKGGDACRAINDCSSIVGYVEAFECFAQMGNDQSKSMYSLSADAIEVAVEVKQFYQVIETTKTICINNAERTYVENTSATYEQLNSCLNGNIPTNPTTRGTTTPRSTTTPTTTTPRTTTYDYTETPDW